MEGWGRWGGLRFGPYLTNQVLFLNLFLNFQVPAKMNDLLTQIHIHVFLQHLGVLIKNKYISTWSDIALSCFIYAIWNYSHFLILQNNLSTLVN